VEGSEKEGSIVKSAFRAELRATMMGIRITYRGATLLRRVIAEGDVVHTTLLSRTSTGETLFHVDREATPSEKTQLHVGKTVSHKRGKASIVYGL
jgi:hypothetical protein